MIRYYAGIGSRETPVKVQALMRGLAEQLSSRFVLRSGGAEAADKAFERGCGFGPCQIIFPSMSFDLPPEAGLIAERLHPAWERCGGYARMCHKRNVAIILGKDLKSPVEFVVCYTVDGGFTGGTGLGMRLAKENNIPIFNLFYAKDLVWLCKEYKLDLEALVEQS